MIGLAKDVSAALASAPRTRLTRRGPLAGDGKPPADEPDAPRPPDAWLERRLRVFERGLSGLESRQEHVEKASRAAAVAAQESIGALQAAIQELKERADAADARHTASANDIRTALNETALRIQTVEGVARAALAESHNDNAPAAPPPEPLLAAPQPPPAPNAPHPPRDDGAPTSFIGAVRKTVAAQAAAAAQADAAVAVRARSGRKSAARYLLGGLVVLAIFLAAAGMAFSKGVDDGRREALSRRMPIAPRPSRAPQTALDRLTARARAGDAAAALRIALRYSGGAHKDPVAAIRWMTRAALQGQPVAQYVLGTMYAPADAGKALPWYEAAARQGNRKAMHALAVAYAEGLGTARNPSEAARWFSRAAALGYVDSQFDLAVLYERGAGVPQSLLDAYTWYAVAGRQGDAQSRLRIEALRTQLHGDALAAAQHAADAFRALPMAVAANSVPQ